MNIDVRNSQSNSQSQSARSLQEIFRIPIVLALLSILGLVSALVGDGVFDWFSWVALGVPVAIIARYGRGT